MLLDRARRVDRAGMPALIFGIDMALRLLGGDPTRAVEQRVIRRIESLALRPRQRFERTRDDCNREPAPSLQLD